MAGSHRKRQRKPLNDSWVLSVVEQPQQTLSQTKDIVELDNRLDTDDEPSTAEATDPDHTQPAKSQEPTDKQEL
ncbi:hypothetical protein Pst134EA_021070, partial [Puccinia striiformis f. sp. tritici]